VTDVMSLPTSTFDSWNIFLESSYACSSLVRKRVGVDLHVLNLDLLLGSVLFVHWNSLNHVKRIPALQDPSKYCVLSIQMRCRRICDVELAAVCPRTFICHAQDAARVMSERYFDLVLEHLSVHRIAFFRASCGGRACLDHEVGDAPVERRAIVAAVRAKSQKIVGGLRTGLTEQLQLDVAGGGLECHRHDRCRATGRGWVTLRSVRSGNEGRCKSRADLPGTSW
jgi:hypothetical protein